jgi:hypothetical protein
VTKAIILLPTSVVGFRLLIYVSSGLTEGCRDAARLHRCIGFPSGCFVNGHLLTPNHGVENAAPGTSIALAVDSKLTCSWLAIEDPLLMHDIDGLRRYSMHPRNLAQ